MSELFWTRDATLSGNDCFRLGTRVWNTDGSVCFVKVQTYVFEYEFVLIAVHVRKIFLLGPTTSILFPFSPYVNNDIWGRGFNVERTNSR